MYCDTKPLIDTDNAIPLRVALGQRKKLLQGEESSGLLTACLSSHSTNAVILRLYILMTDKRYTGVTKCADDHKYHK